MIIEGTLEFDRLDDGGDVWAAKVWPDGHRDPDPAVVIEVMSVLGEAWWAAHANDTELLDEHGQQSKQKIAAHHPAALESLLGKRVRITIEELS